MAATRRHLQGGTLALLDHADLVRELISLEQHPLPSGRPRIAAPSGGTDDYATALLALVAELAGKDYEAASASGRRHNGTQAWSRVPGSCRLQKALIAQATGGPVS